MDASILISNHVINTINSLPQEERHAIAQALVSEMILGDASELPPVQEMLYSVIRFYVRRDSTRYRHGMSENALCDI